MRKNILLVLFFSGLTTSILAQPAKDKAQLEKERQDLQRELK
jgi:hypothetical protein